MELGTRSRGAAAARGLLPMVAWGCACAPAENLKLPFSGDIAWVVAVQSSEESERFGASPLTLWRSDQGVPVAVPWDELLVLGYRGAQLQNLEPLEGEVLTEPLHLARGCEQKLPRPSEVFVSTPAGEVRALSPGLAPALAADWLASRCPSEELGFLPDMTCLLTTCPTASLARSGCALELEWGPCLQGTGLERLEGSLSAAGEACLGPSFREEPICTGAPSKDPGAPLRLDCGEPVSCKIDLYAASDETWALVERAHARGWNGSSPLTPNLDLNDQPTFVQAREGAFRDAVLLGDRLITAVVVPEPLEGCSSPSVLEAFDAESLALLTLSSSTAGLPRCFARLAPGPDGSFLAVLGENPPFRIARFSKDGALEAQRSIELPQLRSEPIDPEWWRVELEALPGGLAGLLFDSRGGTDRLNRHERGTLLLFDGRTLGPVASYSDFPGDESNSDFEIGGLGAQGDDLMVTDNLHDRAIALRRNGNELRQVRIIDLRVAAQLQARKEFGRPSYHEALGQWLVAASGDDASIRGFDLDGLYEVRRLYERPNGLPVEIASWSEARGEVVMSVLEGGPGPDRGEGFLARYDLYTKRFVPGMLHLGHGPTGRLFVASDRALLTTLSWAGEVLRIEPLSP